MIVDFYLKMIKLYIILLILHTSILIKQHTYIVYKKKKTLLMLNNKSLLKKVQSINNGLKKQPLTILKFPKSS